MEKRNIKKKIARNRKKMQLLTEEITRLAMLIVESKDEFDPLSKYGSKCGEQLMHCGFQIDSLMKENKKLTVLMDSLTE